MENKPTDLLVVAGVLRAKSGKWLMHRRPPGKRHAGLWEFPGGKVESGEVPENALCRELAEEVDLAVDPAALKPATFAYGAAEGDHPAILILLYQIADWDGEPVAFEGGAIAWFTPDEIARLDKPPLDVALAKQFFAIPAR